MSELNREQIIKDLECCRFGKDEAKCKECNWHPWIKPRCWRLLASNALSLIKELTEENERLRVEWISVKDKLPKWNGLYLTFQNGKPNISNFDAQKHKFGVWWHYTPDGRYEKNYRFIEADEITHWMPVESPKGE